MVLNNSGLYDTIWEHMLKIRLQRVGRKNNPSFKMIVTDSTAGPKSGKCVEQIGSYDAIRKTRSIDVDRAKYWMSKGALLSDTVHNIFISESLKEGKKVNVLPKKSPIISEETLTEKVEPKAQEETTPTEAVKSETPKETIPTEKVEPKAQEETTPTEAVKSEAPKETVYLQKK